MKQSPNHILTARFAAAEHLHLGFTAAEPHASSHIGQIERIAEELKRG